MPEYEVHTGSHKFKSKSTKWWVNLWVIARSESEIVGKENVFREDVLSDCGGKNFLR